MAFAFGVDQAIGVCQFISNTIASSKKKGLPQVRSSQWLLGQEPNSHCSCLNFWHRNVVQAICQ